MNICLLRERFRDETRVALSPDGIRNLSELGANVYVETEAGKAAGWEDTEYEKAGGTIVFNYEEAIGRADVIVKVLRPTVEESQSLLEGQVIVSYLQLPLAHKDLFLNLVDRKITAIGLENVEYEGGGHPVRRVMSEIAGSLAVLFGAKFLTSEYGGRGVLLGGVPGVPPASVGIIGAGVVGTTAAQKAMDMGAHVVLLDHKIRSLRKATERFGSRIHTAIINRNTVEMICKFVDILVGAVLVEDNRTPHVVSREMVKSMKSRSVIVDVAIDQGGTCETSHPTSITNPIYIEEDVIHYAVPNMPATVPRSATRAYQNQILPYLEMIVEYGIDSALRNHPFLSSGLNVYHGSVTREAVGRAFDRDWITPGEILA